MAVKFYEFKKKPWVVLWRNPWTGKKHTHSFATEQEANFFEMTQQEIACKERRILKQIRRQKSKDSRIKVKELLDSYFNMAHTNPVTIRQSRYHASHIVSAFGNRMASQLQRQDILNFCEAQQLRGIAQITANRRIGILRAALNWGVQNGLLAENPLRDLRLPRARVRRIAPPTAAEARAILQAAAPHVQRVVIIGLCAGPRIGPCELFRLKWTEVDTENAMMRMPSAHKNQLEDGRDIPIRTAILPLMKKWKEHDQDRGIAYVISWGGKPVRTICRAWQAALRRAGIVRRIRPYDLRHGFATYALAGGADIGSVATLMGHTDASMILRTYQHVQEQQKRASVEAAPDILGLATIHDRFFGV